MTGWRSFLGLRRSLSSVVDMGMISLSDRMIEHYLSLSDEELEEMAAGRARLRDTSLSIDERPSGTSVAAFTVPSHIEDADITLLSAEGHDRRRALCALLWLDDQTPQGFGHAV
jgi:hypothetical protein